MTLRALPAFLRDFILGDDPLMFAGVCVTLGATAGVEALGIPAWWLAPLGIVGALAFSVGRARRPT